MDRYLFERYLTLRTASGILGIHYQTVLRFVRTGKIPAVRLGIGPKGHYRIKVGDLEEFIEKRYGEDIGDTYARKEAEGRLWDPKNYKRKDSSPDLGRS